MCGYLCVLCMYACVNVCACTLRIVARDKILHFKNTFIIIITSACIKGMGQI